MPGTAAARLRPRRLERLACSRPTRRSPRALVLDLDGVLQAQALRYARRRARRAAGDDAASAVAPGRATHRRRAAHDARSATSCSSTACSPGYGLLDDDGAVEPLVHPARHPHRPHLRRAAVIHAIAADLLDPGRGPAPPRPHRRAPASAPTARGCSTARSAYRGGPMERLPAGRGEHLLRPRDRAHVHARPPALRRGAGPGRRRRRAARRAGAGQPRSGCTERVASARPRQATTYYSSSDGAFADRYDGGRAATPALLDGTVALEGGWRVYSSGPGLFLRLVVENLLGIRRAATGSSSTRSCRPRLDGLVAPSRCSGDQARGPLPRRPAGLAAPRR